VKKRSLHSFIGATVAAGAIAALLQDWHALFALSGGQLFGVAILVLLGLFSETLALNLEVGKHSGSTSIIFIPVLVSLLLFGSAAALLVMVTAGVTAELVIRKKPAIKAIFNAGQWSLACGLGGLAFDQLQGPTLLEAGGVSVDLLVPFAVYAAILVFVNNALVAGVIAISAGLPIVEVWRKVTGRSGTNVLYDLLISPISLAIAVLYLPLKVAGLLLAFLPLLFIRHSYFTNQRLQEANRDLVKALVKAIETRDPYTSGHSVRVAGLARDIAELLALPARKTDDIETAALLHDIGKIDAIYADLIQKPTDLSPSERAVIESHVTKGVELLRSLSSFPEHVLDAVRHHHEREDGRGYPDQLKAEQIPIGAKIIKICDAVDAMLSDRPYRRALSLMQVKDQLTHHAGVQFDSRIVRVVVGSTVLERHAAEIALHRAGPVQVRPLHALRSRRPMDDARFHRAT
jgi:putative nucleotidyltransferase with HDIG domain